MLKDILTLVSLGLAMSNMTSILASTRLTVDSLKDILGMVIYKVSPGSALEIKTERQLLLVEYLGNFKARHASWGACLLRDPKDLKNITLTTLNAFLGNITILMGMTMSLYHINESVGISSIILPTLVSVLSVAGICLNYCARYTESTVKPQDFSLSRIISKKISKLSSNKINLDGETTFNIVSCISLLLAFSIALTQLL